MENKLHSIYYDPSQGLTNLTSFYNRVKENKLKVTYSQVRHFYEKQSINQIFKEPKPQIRESITAPDIGSYLQADLVDIKKFKFKNSGFKYLLNIIDVYSRYAFSFPITSKGSPKIKDHLEEVYKEVKKHVLSYPQTLTTDSGTEFLNNKINSLNEKYNVKHFTIVSKNANHPTVTGIIERFNKTLWGLIARYTESIDSVKFIDVLNKLITRANRLG